MPRVRQTFETMKEVHTFYTDYAKIAGFSVRTVRTSKETVHYACSNEGWNKNKNSPKLTEKGSKRCGCPAFVKVKEDMKGKIWYFDNVREDHNHMLRPSPRFLRFMHAHKHMEKGLCDIFNIMSRNGVPHKAALNVMADLHEGRHMWGFTEKTSITCKWFIFTTPSISAIGCGCWLQHAMLKSCHICSWLVGFTD